MRLAALFSLGTLALACAAPRRDAEPQSSPTASTARPVVSIAPPVEEPDATVAPNASPDAAMTNADPPFSGPALPRNPNDLAWLTELVRVASDRPVTLDELGEYLGKPAGAEPLNPGRRLVKAHSPYLAKVSVYPLPHIHIDLAVDLEFAEGSRPGRSAVASALGPLAPMPRAPDDFHSGQKLSFYRKGKHGTARVFVELDPKNDTQVRGVHVDVDGVASK